MRKKHLYCIKIRDECDSEFMLEFMSQVRNPFVKKTRDEFHLRIDQLCLSLVEPLAVWASLGTHIAAVLQGAVPPGFTQSPLPRRLLGEPFKVVENLIPALAAQHSSYAGLVLDVSEERFSRDEGPPFLDYWCWSQQEVKKIHLQILAQHGMHLGDDQDETGTWISASEATVFDSSKFKCKLNLSGIYKLFNAKPPPFRSRSRGYVAGTSSWRVHGLSDEEGECSIIGRR